MDKNEYINVAVTAEEKAQFKEKADAVGMTLSDYLREFIINGVVLPHMVMGFSETEAASLSVSPDKIVEWIVLDYMAQKKADAMAQQETGKFIIRERPEFAGDRTEPARHRFNRLFKFWKKKFISELSK